MKRYIPFLLVVAALAFWFLFADREASGDGAVDRDAAFDEAFENGLSGIMLQGEGTVDRLLPDDNEGSRHQRFIVMLRSGQTLLISHNIDLAPRIAGLESGDGVEFRGEYEWNSQGGVVHWTHHDPDGDRDGGWILHEGKVYE